ncbi:MAG: elongation factor G [Elusimicrobiota bacterium]|nr:elongation factor G [Elusimicrobiota bacterium]
MNIEKIRNIGFVAHIDAGKTTTTERVLYYTGRIHRIGEVDEGTATMDWMIQEKERGITITSATTTCFWRNCVINIIDTPGHVDFTAEVERSLRVLDGCIVIFDGVNGVEPQSETVWRQADKYKVPRLIFINKLDRQVADFNSVIEQIKLRLDAQPLLLQLPYYTNSKFQGIIDLLTEKLYLWEDETDKNPKEYNLPKEYEPEVKKRKEKELEKIAELDEKLMTKFVHSEEIDINEVMSVIRHGTISCKFFPVVCGSALKNCGIQKLLDAIVDYLPAPVDLPAVNGINPKTSMHESRKPSIEESFSALAFKVQIDPYVGRLVYIRIYSGKITAGSSVYNSRLNKHERISRILKMHANARQDLKEAFCGDIVAVIGPRYTSTGDTLCDRKHLVAFESISFPEPVIWAAIEPKTKLDEEKLTPALRAISDEDPTFKLKVDDETNQVIISGMGELHLEIIADRLNREFKVNTRLGKPQVAYREAITRKSVGEGKYIKQTGGRGQYGHVVLQVEPFNSEPGAKSNFKFESALSGGVIPREYIPAIERGIKDALDSGPLAGYPVINISATLIDGSYHEVDSSEIAFRIAAREALKNALRTGDPILLEPIMKLEVITPEEYIGDILSDLNLRRAKIVNSEVKAKMHHIYGFVPLSEMFGYATTLRTLSQGKAIYNMEPAHYEQMSYKVLEQTGILSLVTQ